jgi:outer membrane protein OmpA-like peptidoglycan-associated protein
MTLTNKTVLGTAFSALLVGTLSMTLPEQASADGSYLTSGEGHPVLSSNGGCVHTGSWKDSMPTCPEPTLVVEDDDAMIVFAVDDSEFFGFDKVKLSDEAKADLDTVVGAVANADLIHGITVTGHADRIGPAPYNEQLAQRRAQAVKDYLVSRGIAAERIQTASDGSSEPLVSCPNVKNEHKLIHCLAPNRRVDVEALLANNVDLETVTLVPSGA